MRLELSLQLQKIFQEMLYILDWMEEIKVKLTVFLTEKDKKSSITEKIWGKKLVMDMTNLKDFHKKKTTYSS